MGGELITPLVILWFNSFMYQRKISTLLYWGASVLPWLSHCINRLGDRFLNSSWSADWFNSNFWFYAKISYNHKILQLVCLHLKQTNWPTEYAFQTISVRLEFDLTGFTRINLIWTKQMWKPLQYEWCSPTLQKKQQQKKPSFVYLTWQILICAVSFVLFSLVWCTSLHQKRIF